MLVAIEPLNEQNLSPTLAMEADEVIVLDKAFISPQIRLREEAGFGDAIVTGTETEPVSIGRAFGLEWLSGATSDEIIRLRRSRPRIGAELDRD